MGGTVLGAAHPHRVPNTWEKYVQAESLTAGQWWIVALVVSALFLGAVHFTLRNGRATLYSLIAPVAGGISVLGASRARGHSEVEALIMFSASLLSLALFLVALRPELEKIRAKALVGETYEIPKWKSGVYGILVVTFAVVAVFMLL
ncbi:hypothetical protein ACIA71_34815 [Streptomyces anulatus]|uniref:hypothetical protein n=1 Tax=Streptomyces anulatus TaxID=1892 RepID=UPI00379365FA|nr:hypothetical protein OG536_23210 [Streptomyces anulatus]